MLEEMAKMVGFARVRLESGYKQTPEDLLEQGFSRECVFEAAVRVVQQRLIDGVKMGALLDSGYKVEHVDAVIRAWDEEYRSTEKKADPLDLHPGKASNRKRNRSSFLLLSTFTLLSSSNGSNGSNGSSSVNNGSPRSLDCSLEGDVSIPVVKKPTTEKNDWQDFIKQRLKGGYKQTPRALLEQGFPEDQVDIVAARMVEDYVLYGAEKMTILQVWELGFRAKDFDAAIQEKRNMKTGMHLRGIDEEVNDFEHMQSGPVGAAGRERSNST